MRKIAMIVSAVVMLAGIGIAGADEAQPVDKAAEGQTVKQQTVCPIMGGEVNKSVYADADGKRVYFCCKGCPAEFKKDSSKYIAKMEKDGITLDKAPTATPSAKQAANAEAASAQKGCACCE